MERIGQFHVADIRSKKQNMRSVLT